MLTVSNWKYSYCGSWMMRLKLTGLCNLLLNLHCKRRNEILKHSTISAPNENISNWIPLSAVAYKPQWKPRFLSAATLSWNCWQSEPMICVVNFNEAIDASRSVWITYPLFVMFGTIADPDVEDNFSSDKSLHHTWLIVHQTPSSNQVCATPQLS
jgi:hypothetical protein